ncbi:hypothetical protein HDC92_002622 [Pedobacter sp. AK017]|uniref:FecR family protein n=1 Tax=Pedobacter sp. AK017 TaxID=2723073 RepID=UPI001615CA94|nr:FecR family protein [Pedobacter sp. AK017]MBB5438938.1 hypothetical protein [Pedobacter sp. AK017]
MDIKEIADKIVKGEASEQEIRFYQYHLENLMKQHTSDETLLPSDQDLLNKIHLLIERNERKLNASKQWYLPAKIAASVILFITVAWFSINYRNQNLAPTSQRSGASAKQLISYTPGKNKAMLILGDGRTMFLDSIQNGTNTLGNSNVIKNDSSLNYLPVAAGLASNQINTLYTPRGGQYKLTMADGTKVWLNASSSIKFPVQFDKNNRTVTLSGEAYFEVKKKPHQPFLVQLPDGNTVEVLGTHFNIKAYPHEISKTSLMEGKITFRHKERTYLLQPGEEIYADSTHSPAQVLKKFDENQILAWKNGFFHFNNTPVDQVLQEFSRWYNVNIEYRGKLTSKHFDGVISRNINSDELIKMLSYSGLKLTTQKNKIIVE